MDRWHEYRRRVQALALLDLTPEQYEQHCKRIAKELAI